jgi:hypothetical protein
VLSDLARDLKADLSDAIKMTGNAASKTIAGLGDLAGGIPASGGEVKEADRSADLDDDGKPDAVTAVEYDDQILWLIEASAFEGFACKTQLYLVTDNPPETILGCGLLAEGCGASACAVEELEKDEPDVQNCECQDAEGDSIACTDLYATLGGGSSGGGEDDECPSGSEGTPPDCSPIEGGGEPTALACSDGSDAIPFEQVCDGTSDCGDDSDEACGVVWLCGSGEAAAASSVCDGETDCSDASDEASCSDADWICDNGTEAVENAWLCDAEADCSDGSDEASCEIVWVCDDGEEVIVAGGVCDGASDCSDGSDEARCE